MRRSVAQNLCKRAFVLEVQTFHRYMRYVYADQVHVSYVSYVTYVAYVSSVAIFSRACL